MARNGRKKYILLYIKNDATYGQKLLDVTSGASTGVGGAFSPTEGTTLCMLDELLTQSLLPIIGEFEPVLIPLFKPVQGLHNRSTAAHQTPITRILDVSPHNGHLRDHLQRLLGVLVLIVVERRLVVADVTKTGEMIPRVAAVAEVLGVGLCVVGLFADTVRGEVLDDDILDGKRETPVPICGLG